MRPTGRLLALLALWATLGLMAAVWPLTFGLWAGFGGVLVLLVLLDAALLGRIPLPTVERSLPAALAVGEWHEVRIRLDSRTNAALSVWDHTPPSWEVEGMPRPLKLQEGQWTEVVYRARPRERGLQVVAQLDLLLTGER